MKNANADTASGEDETTRPSSSGHLSASSGVPLFAYLELSAEHRQLAVTSVCESIVSADERRLFAILSSTTDLEDSVKTFATDVKRHLRKAHGVDDPSGIEDLNGDTCLHYAARSGHAVVLRFLHHCGLLKRIDEYVNREGDTPLHEAVAKRRVMFVKQLMFLGANPKAVNRHGKSPLSLARKLADPQLLDALKPPPVVMQ